jgi:hypothetical protein
MRLKSSQKGFTAIVSLFFQCVDLQCVAAEKKIQLKDANPKAMHLKSSLKKHISIVSLFSLCGS